MQTESDMPMIEHLIELRKRLLTIVVSVLVVFLCLFYFANDLYEFVSAPLQAELAAGSSMIATDPASPFFTPFKLTLVLSFFIAIPIILHQMWAFIAPGLYQSEKRLALPLLASSVVLFYCGVAFGYYAFLPVFFSFITGIAPESIQVMTDISSYLDFVIKIFIAMGFAFEIPIATMIMVWVGITTPKQLAEKRPYVIVGIFIVAMFLTPPDPISQIMMAIPMLLLFESGIFFSKFIVKNKKNTEESDESN
jgi:sec-independent protein translocase protein TatC